MNSKAPTTILIVEDQSLVRDAIAMLLSLEDDLTIVEKCSNGKEAIDYLNDNPAPHIILSDIEMPLVSGLDLAAHIAKQNLNTKVVLMTTFSKPGYIKRALSLGVKGFILKESDSDYLIDAIHKVSAGEKVISTEPTNDLNQISLFTSAIISITADSTENLSTNRELARAPRLTRRVSLSNNLKAASASRWSSPLT